jgi:hypothetical protein
MRHLNIVRPSWRLPRVGPGVDLRARWRHHRDRLVENFGLVAGVLLLSCATLWAAGEYAREKSELRTAETHRYIAEFRAAPVADAWRRLTQAWHAEQARQDALLQRIALHSGAGLEIELRHYRAFVIDTVTERRLARDVDTMLQFYRRLALCIRFGACDPALAAGHFGTAARSFRNQHYYHLQEEYQVDEVDRTIEAIAPGAVRGLDDILS